MDAAQLVEEIRLAEEEHARALAEMAAALQRVETARVDAAKAQALERERERNMQQAAEQLAVALQSIELTGLELPRVRQYLVEYHANIGCYHCYLWVEGDPSAADASSLSVQVEGTRVSIVNSRGTWWTVELERKVDAEGCSIVAKSDHVYIRLPLNDSDKETADGFSSFSYTSSDELRVASYQNLRCRCCSATFVAASHQFDKALPLPSENWMEMFDFWGAGIGSFEHIPREGISAQFGRVFVGEATIMVHEDDLIAGSVVDCSSETKASVHAGDGDDSEVIDRDWRSVCCSSCGTELGERRVDHTSTLRLQKYLLSTGPTDTQAASANVFSRYSIDSTISAQLLHVAESDGVFRFAILATPSPEQDTTPFSGLRLQLLSWDAKIQTSDSAPDFRRVLKVVYSSDSIPAASASPENLLPAILRTHELLVTPAVGLEVSQRLQQSTLLLPPSQRQFNKMQVGFLH